MTFISLADNPAMRDVLIRNMEENADWHGILPWLKEMTARCGTDTLPMDKTGQDWLCHHSISLPDAVYSRTANGE